MKSKLIKLTLTIGKDEVEMTKDEARELYNALSEIFEVKRETVYIDRYKPWSWPYYSNTSFSLTTNTNANEQAAKQLAANSFSFADGKMSLSAKFE